MDRKLFSILGNSQRLDGGSMFGNAPRALWSRWFEPDALHRIPLACRCLLVEDAGRRILFETGIGSFFTPKLRERYGVVEERHVLLDSLAQRGLSHEDIDVVVLSHLHFDHAGGLLGAWLDGAPPELLFPNARFVVGTVAWERACAPHARDRASFIPAVQELLADSGRLELVPADKEHSPLLGEGFRFHRSHGHTPGLLLGEIAMPEGPLLFAADLIPGMPWVHLPITMGYDRFPELLIDEKAQLLKDLLGRSGRIFFTHDPKIALARIGQDERGRFRGEDGLEALDGLAA
jgi:glyoxylase-like metal-dependent hydrolase (beta-lactamase superfamily II)